MPKNSILITNIGILNAKKQGILNSKKKHLPKLVFKMSKMEFKFYEMDPRWNDQLCKR